MWNLRSRFLLGFFAFRHLHTLSHVSIYCKQDWKQFLEWLRLLSSVYVFPFLFFSLLIFCQLLSSIAVKFFWWSFSLWFLEANLSVSCKLKHVVTVLSRDQNHQLFSVFWSSFRAQRFLALFLLHFFFFEFLPFFCHKSQAFTPFTMICWGRANPSAKFYASEYSSPCLWCLVADYFQPDFYPAGVTSFGQAGSNCTDCPIGAICRGGSDVVSQVCSHLAPALFSNLPLALTVLQTSPCIDLGQTRLCKAYLASRSSACCSLQRSLVDKIARRFPLHFSRNYRLFSDNNDTALIFCILLLPLSRMTIQEGDGRSSSEIAWGSNHQMTYFSLHVCSCLRSCNLMFLMQCDISYEIEPPCDLVEIGRWQAEPKKTAEARCFAFRFSVAH